MDNFRIRTCSDGIIVCDTRMQSERFVKGEIVPIVKGISALVNIFVALETVPQFIP